MKKVFCLFLVVAIISIPSVGNLAIASNYVSEEYLSGAITSDTVWITGHIYKINGTLTIAQDTSLTIQPGVLVYLYPDYDLRVEGTLIAKGTSVAPICFREGGSIVFTQTSTGSILEYCTNLPNIDIYDASPKINENDEMRGLRINGGNPIISNNVIVHESFSWDEGDHVACITVMSGSPLISSNTLYDATFLEIQQEGGQLFSASIMYGVALIGDNSAIISDNIFEALNAAIYVSSGEPIILRNIISSDYASGTGIIITETANPAVNSNTITNNYIGINLYATSADIQITNNNIYGNNKFSICLGQEGVYDTIAKSIDATYNWWGTTDLSIINRTIYDHKNNFEVGTVTFIPILTGVNFEALSNSTESTSASAPIASQTSAGITSNGSTQNPTVTSDKSENEAFFSSWGLIGVVIVVLLAVIAVLLLFVVFYLRRRSVGGSVG